MQKKQLINLIQTCGVIGILCAGICAINVWGTDDSKESTDSNIQPTVSQDSQDSDRVKLIATLPAYAQKYANSRDDIYSLSDPNTQGYTKAVNGNQVTVSQKELVNAVYFDDAYLAQYVSTDKMGMLNVFCEVTTANDIYVYDLYGYKGMETEYTPLTEKDNAILEAVKAQYMEDVETPSSDIGEAKFSSITITNVRWGKGAVNDTAYNRVLVEFKAVSSGIATNNYALVQLNSTGNIEQINLI